MKRYGLLIDTSRCIGCRSCQVTCKQWNQLEAEKTVNTGSFENPPDLSDKCYNKIRFIEVAEKKNGVDWYFLSQRCMHCAEPGCVKVCPSGALKKSETGAVAVDKTKCIGCNYCKSACPFNVPRYSEDRKVAKCTLCNDRVLNGMQPACAKGCAPGAIKFGEWDELLKEAKASGKSAYGADSLGGTGVLYILEDKPEVYGLSPKPQIPLAVTLWKDILRPIGLVAFVGAIVAAAGHYAVIGPKSHEEKEGE
ncbi:4Fe-4S dicluster domain-containing protein [bacterium]|nr:MAG: 4Fe-4S dicluster domain-containing protein [bacterium]